MTDEHTSTPSKWLIPALSILALILVILFALGVIGGGEKVAPGNTSHKLSPLPTGAETLTLGKELSDNVMSWPGTIRSRSIAKIAPKLNARILEVTVNAGDTVKKGDVIARLDEQALRASYQEAVAVLNAAQSQAKQAIADEKRIKELYSKDAATRQNYDAVVARANTARANVRQARSALKQVNVNLDENILLAPFDGIISERLKEPGDMGLPNDPIVILQKQDDLRMEAAIPTNCAKRITLGMEVDIRIDTLNKTITGVIDEIVPEIDPLTRTQLVKAALPSSEGLIPGLFAWMEQSCEEHQNVLRIPASAVLHYGQLEAVKIVEDNQVYTRHIRTGKQRGDKVEVLSGLREGETILINSGLVQ
ncbi:efflux RND transporter periplasmic adaptor subunit [Methylomarinum sp. Ch1-1]|uniref:Efflux RND transporter periplasmic adaptor subunit n=1 Tax=Methylomarinum roseum TaxID=3067653 RepID=A0AAU7NQI7_9GAMM|nr:efflux RND transporter periplasmic adaptor subunit [Methylomarinum sp. Ch1-1]MDP4520812.1 efflux RND transporter periplasmic adaptor subunit [Methylomarinum sp. Ch1-1]